ncbi:hypothetical protein IM793_23500 [Pedobacter sp. MR2016-19]|uniref:hypothetical protein n=1 Tax=unclassified Pedobacter TaxID=2628915 RepID=UPI001046E850|nr:MULTISPECIES: hypothetical protein [unclassified Pedobacter]MBE5322139.1 hypothetical protein [Pedobacter sp. MR2016-19]QXU42195.1 hypothetical protein KYH19_00915 [Pedobacter sp. D749]
MKKSILTLLALLPLISFGQAYAEPSGTPLGAFLMFLLGLAVFLIIFLALRQVVLWYWKVETLLKNQNEQTRILTSIYNSIEENNRLTQSQIELVIGKDTDIL